MEDGSSKIDLVGSVKKSDSISSVAQNLRNLIGMTFADQEECPAPREAFNLWRQKLEALGILVFQVQGVAVEEMRGFALPNDFAPVVVVNSADSANAKIFTLLHEVSHLLLGESAITGSGEFETEFSGGQDEERFCNRVAAETIIPEENLRSRIRPDWDLESGEVLKLLSKAYKVSQSVIAIRLSEIGLIDAVSLRRILRILSSRQTIPDDRDIRVSPYRLALSRNGNYFSRIAVGAFYSGSIHGGELASLLGMRLKHLTAIEHELFPERIQAFA
jgi:Zn-dependent peptidase ImmA (M78 family)